MERERESEGGSDERRGRERAREGVTNEEGERE